MIITGGNRAADEDGAAAYNLENGILTHEYTLDEQGSNDVLVFSTGETIIGGTDPTQDWSFGNIYTKQSGVWSMKRTLPNVIHTWGACEHNGLLYVATSGHIGDNTTWEGKVFWSNDFGDTWVGSSVVSDYRVYDVQSFNGDLWASASDLSSSQSLQRSIDNGLSWTTFPGVIPRYRHRLGIYLNQLLVVNFTLDSISLIDTLDNVVNINFPSGFSVVNEYNVVCVNGTDLYVLGGIGSNKVYKYNGTIWSYHCDIGVPCVSLLNFDSEFMIASSMGTDATIYRIGYT